MGCGAPGGGGPPPTCPLHRSRLGGLTRPESVVAWLAPQSQYRSPWNSQARRPDQAHLTTRRFATSVTTAVPIRKPGSVALDAPIASFHSSPKRASHPPQRSQSSLAAVLSCQVSNLPRCRPKDSLTHPWLPRQSRPRGGVPRRSLQVPWLWASSPS